MIFEFKSNMYTFAPYNAVPGLMSSFKLMVLVQIKEFGAIDSETGSYKINVIHSFSINCSSFPN